MSKVYNKKKLVFGLVTVAVATTGFFVGKAFYKPKKSIEISELEIKLPEGKSTIKIGSSQNAVIQALGKPKQIAPYSLQANYKQGTVLNYNGAKFIFIHNKLANFEITSHKYRVGLASTHKYNTIGNSTAELSQFKIENKTALLDVTSEDSTTDQYLEYDLNDSGKVTKISYADY